jgi:hypothetical protein
VLIAAVTVVVMPLMLVVWSSTIVILVDDVLLVEFAWDVTIVTTAAENSDVSPMSCLALAVVNAPAATGGKPPANAASGVAPGQRCAAAIAPARCRPAVLTLRANAIYGAREAAC